VTHPPSIPPADPSATTSDIARRDSQQLRNGRLGVFAVAFFVISAAAPLTAMAGGAPVAMLLGNGPGIPAAYVVVSLILLIFAVGYTAMARHHTSTGAFYSFVSRGLRQPAGGAAAIIALLGYNAMQIGLYGLFAAAAAGFLSDNLGINLPWWVYAFVAMAIIAVLGYRQVDLSVKVLSILVSLEFLIVLILDAAILIQGGEGGTAPLNAVPFTWASFTSGSVAIALLFNFASFIGFEATTIYSEEARDPKRTVPQATYVAVLTIGVFYTVTTYLMVEGQGAAGLQEYLGGLQPDPTAVLIFLVTQQDPVLALFTWLTQLGTLAIIVLMALASFAVVAFFARNRDLDTNLARTMIAPIVGGVAMTAVAIYAASQFGLLIGNPDSPLRWILPALILISAIGGIIAAINLKARSPELYGQMGRHRDIELTPGA
jgi:amino acid transporter